MIYAIVRSRFYLKMRLIWFKRYLAFFLYMFGRCVSGGRTDSPFVILGESPGKEELINGKPFSSKGLNSASHLLRKWLKPYHLDKIEEEFFLINAIHFDVNDKNYWTESRKTKAGLRCRERMLKEIFSKDRRVILVFGDVALRMFTDIKDLSLGGNAAKGIPPQYGWHIINHPETRQNIWIMHTYHPTSTNRTQCMNDTDRAVTHYLQHRQHYQLISKINEILQPPIW